MKKGALFDKSDYYLNYLYRRPWQGDSSVSIDRFDVRAHLDYIPETKSSAEKSASQRAAINFNYDDPDATSSDTSVFPVRKDAEFAEESSDSQLAPRIKILQANQIFKEPKLLFLQTDWMELWRFFRHLDLWPLSMHGWRISGPSRRFCKTWSKAGDKRLDVSELTTEQCKLLNSMAVKYGMRAGDFSKCMWEDYEEQARIQNLKEIEDERVALAGKQSRRERKLLKEIRIRDRGCVARPLDVLRIDNADNEKTNNRSYSTDSSSSSSESSSDEEIRKTSNKKDEIQFITTFGDPEESDTDEKLNSSSAVKHSDQSDGKNGNSFHSKIDKRLQSTFSSIVETIVAFPQSSPSSNTDFISTNKKISFALPAG
uniref:Suppressor of white apricot N-terminal domain-containing protein n=1 Tax=Romanomermis culicivorax TaxID=13658 RepID=A0A915IFT7_ROMCU